MRSSKPIEMFAALPDPGEARTLDDLADRLRLLKIWAGDPSYEVVKDRVNAAWTAAGRPVTELTKKATVVDCFRPGRRRLNTDLVLAVVRALHPDSGYVAQWRQVLHVVLAERQAASQVRAYDTLPADLVRFTGRGSELNRLRRALRRTHDTAGAVEISVIEGMAGIGKTRLAVHAGHVLAREHPVDQVLFVDLRGFHPDPAQPPADPAAVIDSFLRLLGVPGQQIPHDLPARAALYRRRLAGRRGLVVLDNAASEEQLQPLLPRGADCITLVTSRRRLGGLRPAIHLSVDVFTPDEALDFLAWAVPDIPVGADLDAQARVARRCGYLPLALGLIAGHIRARPDWTFTDHADWLDERHRGRRVHTGVEVALNLSYQHLPADRRRVFRLLSLHPGHDVDIHAAAALAGTDIDTARAHLHQLADDHLVQQTRSGRFVLHDLVRAYSAGRARDEERPPDRRAALTRLFDHYLHTAATAMDILSPAEQHRRPRIPAPATPTPPIADPIAARGWLDTERVNLIATVAHTATNGWPHHTTRLAITLFRYLDDTGHYGDAIAVHSHARSAAHHSGDRAAEAHALINLGGGYYRQSRYPQAVDFYQRACALFHEIGDLSGEARALDNLNGVYQRLGRYQDAVDHSERSLAVFREIGDRFGEAHALASLGGVYRRLGRYRQATEHHRKALALFRGLGDRSGETFTLGALGFVYQRLGRYAQAIDHHEQALTRCREIGDRSAEANTLTNLGAVYQRLGRYQQAADHHRQALRLFREMDDRGGEAEALNGLGETLLADGQPEHALAHHSTALALADDIGDRDHQGRAHDGLARIHRTTNDLDRARHHWQQALTIYTELGVPEADEVRAHLADLDHGRR